MNSIVGLLLIASLESPRFETRQAAEVTLRGYGVESLMYLEVGRKDASLEARKRIDRVHHEITCKVVDSWTKGQIWREIWTISHDSIPYAIKEAKYQIAKSTYKQEHKIESDLHFAATTPVEVYRALAREATRLLVLDRILNDELTFEHALRMYSTDAKNYELRPQPR